MQPTTRPRRDGTHQKLAFATRPLPLSLARALTSRRKEAVTAAAGHLGRAASQRSPNAKPIDRADISLPLALVSTTNMLSYEAPDIADAHHVRELGGRYILPSASPSPSSPSSSPSSDNESEPSGSVRSFHTDATSVDLPSPNLSDSADRMSKSAAPDRAGRDLPEQRSLPSMLESQPSAQSLYSTPPRIPWRAVSQNKASPALSPSSLSSSPTSSPLQERASSGSTRSSSNSLGAQSADQWRLPPSTSAASATHPFGQELAQLNQAAEEFGAAMRSAEAEADLQAMRAYGLIPFRAADYMDMISGMHSRRFEDDLPKAPPLGWI